MEDYIKEFTADEAFEVAIRLYSETGKIHFCSESRKGVFHVMPEEPICVPQVECGFTFSNADELSVKAKAPNYIVNNILETDSHGILGGSSMAFKTFVAIRLAHSVCTGISFMGLRCITRERF